MARITNFGKIDTLTESGELLVPLVIFSRIKNSQEEFVGFIPALTKKDIVCLTKEECKTKLKQTAKQILSNMAKENKPFPFFPTKAEILEEHKNTKEIVYIKIKSEKRKS